MNFSVSPFAPDNLVLRDRFGRPVPRWHSISILRPNLVLTHGIPPASRDGVHWCITHLRTDSVHCREAAGAGPVVLKVVPVMYECCLFRYQHGPIHHPPVNLFWVMSSVEGSTRRVLGHQLDSFSKERTPTGCLRDPVGRLRRGLVG